MNLAAQKTGLINMESGLITRQPDPKKETVCNCCGSVYQIKDAKKVYTNYGGNVREIKYCSDKCADEVVEFIGARASRVKSKIRTQFLFR